MLEINGPSWGPKKEENNIGLPSIPMKRLAKRWRMRGVVLDRLCELGVRGCVLEELRRGWWARNCERSYVWEDDVRGIVKGVVWDGLCEVEVCFMWGMRWVEMCELSVGWVVCERSCVRGCVWKELGKWGVCEMKYVWDVWETNCLRWVVWV